MAENVLLDTIFMEADAPHRKLIERLWDTPHDDVLHCAAVDCLQERGCDPSYSQEMVDTARRFGIAKQLVDELPKLRTAIRSVVGVPASVPISVLGVESPVKLTGTGPYHTFRGSTTRVHAPGAARRAGCKIDYHADTRRVTVGASEVLRIARETLSARQLSRFRVEK